MRKYLFFMLVFMILIGGQIVSAESISLMVDQSEFYFLTGQEAVIPLTMNNTYDKAITGQLSYSIVQTINQNGMQYSSTKSNAQSFTIPKENQTIGLNFGSSDTPVMLTVSMEFSYSYEDDDYLVSLDDIIIYFVSNQSQMNNQNNPQQSSSEKIINAPQQDPQQDQQQPQTTQEKLQNNQLNQDSQALKEQMQQQMQEQQQMEDEFEQMVNNNSEVQDIQESLKNQGYQQIDSSFEPKTNNTGSFNYTFENEKGETANLEGEMENGTISSLQSLTTEDRQQMLETLNQSSRFQDYQQQLENEGFNQTDRSFHQEGNRTTVELTYKNDENETATITAEFEDQSLQELRLEKQEDFLYYLVIVIILVFIILVLLYVYWRFQKQRLEDSSSSTAIVNEPFDYRREANELLSAARKDFENGLFKDAYGKAAQSLRLFLRYHHGIKHEMTNDEIISFLKDVNQPHDDIKQCLDLCSLVEFAKYQANEPDFSQIVQIATKVIRS